MDKKWVPIKTKAQILHTLIICGIGLLGTILVCLVEIFFLDLVHTKLVEMAPQADQVVTFLASQEQWIFYALVALLTLGILGLFFFTLKFTDRIFGPVLSMDRDIKKMTFLGQFKSGMLVRKRDFVQGMVKQYKRTCEDLDTVRELYADAYKEIDSTIEAQRDVDKEKKKAS